MVYWANGFDPSPQPSLVDGPVYAGVDLGTAYLSLVVVDANGLPVAGEYEFAQVVRDGLVVDFAGAVDRIRRIKARLEARIGKEITKAASAFPPGVPRAEVRATANVVEAAEMECLDLIDEPSAANKVLRMQSGAVVDVGGGTTGVAVIKNSEVVYTADEATGGTHFTLVIAGALDIPFEEAENLKINPAEQSRLFPVIRPVMEKVGSIVQRHIESHDVEAITLVGGSSAFPGFADVVAEYTGTQVQVADHPVLVTPLGIALECRELQMQL